MVGCVNRKGLHDWIVQRVTAVLMIIYAVLIFAFLLAARPLSYDKWHALFSHWAMQIFTFIIVLSILWHAWIGLWTVFTDYVKNKPIRMILQTVVFILLLGYLAWTYEILWLAH